ncbi:MAG: hypothetical protein H7A39_06980 [Chlamydiales bacterium]|nr:hypothetical protein [Chlamydiales bacterium]
MDWLNMIVVITTIIGALYIFVAQLKEQIEQLSVKMSIEDAKLDNKIETYFSKLDKKIDAVHDHLDKKIDAVHDRLDKKIDAIHDHLDKKIDKLEADLVAVRRDVNRNTSHLSNIEGQMTQLTRPNIIRIEREDIERKPLSGPAEKLNDMVN